MIKSHKKLAPTPKYVSPAQLSLEGFETPFERSLNPKNRWVVLARLILWDEICNIYLNTQALVPLADYMKVKTKSRWYSNHGGQCRFLATEFFSRL